MAINSKNEIRAGIFLNYINIVLLTLSSLIVTPVLINGMGLSMYGVYVVVFSITTFFNAGDFGIAIPVIRNIVEFKTSNNKEGLENYLFKTFFVYLLFASVAFVICSIIYFSAPILFEKRFNINEIHMFKKMFFIMTINCTLLFFVNYFFAIITAHDNFPFTRINHIIRAILRTVLLFLIVTHSFEPYAAFLLDLMLTVLLLASYMIFVFLKMGIVIKNHNISARVKATLNAMLLSYWMAMSENASGTLCPMIIAASLGTEDTSRFSIAITFITIYIQLSATLSQLRMPMLSKLWFAADNRDGFWSYTLTSGRIQTIALGFILVGFIILGKPFLNIWVGSDFNASYMIALLIMTAMFLSLSQSMLEVSLYAQNKYLMRSVVLFASSAISMALVWIFVRIFGLMGSGYAIMITTILFNFIGMNLYYRRVYPKMNEFNMEIIMKMLIPVSVSSIVGLIIVNISANSILLSLLGGVVGISVYLVLVYLTYFKGIPIKDLLPSE